MLFQTENETESNKKLREISFKSMLVESLDLIAVLFSAILTHSMIAWFDLAGAFNAELHSAFVFLITRKIGKIGKDPWQFDVARLEVMASFICDLMMTVGYIALVAGAIPEIFDPSAVNKWIVYYFVLKIIAVIFDLYFYYNQRKNYVANPSDVNETETANCRNNLLIDALIAVVSAASFAFPKYEWSLYISPVATVLLSCYFIIGNVRRIKKSFNELVSTAVPSAQQDEIIDILKVS